MKPYAPELKVKELESYKGAYCGLCKELGRKYGLLSRFLLNYDLLFLALLQDGLSSSTPHFCKERCIAHPFSKRTVCSHTAGLSYAADALVLLAYYKLLDTLQDERFFKKWAAALCRPLLAHWRKKAAALHKELDEALCTASEKQFALEKEKNRSLDAACEPTGMMVSAIFAGCLAGEDKQGALRRLGMFSGQVIYLLDAAEDFEDDRRLGRYNPLVLQFDSRQEALEAARQRVQMARGEMALCYQLLDLPLYKELLDNIIFLGLEGAVQNIGTKQSSAVAL